MKTRDKELAVQAGWIKEAGEPDAGCLNLERFVKLVRADEFEACARLCDARVMGDNNREDMEAKRCAADIRSFRARSNR